MSTNKTTNYNLHAWVPEDDFLRSEFNDNFAGIDAALKSLSDSIAAEAAAREAAVSAEAAARQSAVSAEQSARQSAITTLTTGKVELVTGTYEGNDSASMDVPLGFQPKAVLIVCMDGYMGTTNGYQYGGLCLPGLPLRSHGTGKTGHALAEITSTGFTVHKDNGSGSYLNSSQYMYYYLALK